MWNVQRNKADKSHLEVMERGVEARLRSEVNFCELLFCLKPRKRNIDVILTLNMLLEKSRENHMFLHCVFVDL